MEVRKNSFYYKTPVLSFMASENGSAARRIIDAVDNGEIVAKVGIVISNNTNAPIVRWCEKNGIPHKIISKKTNRNNEDDELCRVLKYVNTDLVCLSGYRKKIGPSMLYWFNKRILNIHPSLLPDHGGHGMFGDIIHASALKSGRNITGITIHVVDENYDSGPIIVQKEVPIMKNDTVMSLGNRVRNEEPALYVETVKKVLSGEWVLGVPHEKSIEMTIDSDPDDSGFMVED